MSGHYVEASMPTIQVFSLPTFTQQASFKDADADTSNETFHVISLQESSFLSSLKQELIESEKSKDSFVVEASKMSTDVGSVMSTFPCRMCDKTFASAKTRSQHKLNMHSTVSKNKTNLIVTCSCL